MPNFTKAAIKQSFLKLLDERPLGKISVKDIVEDCGINRNSFYYHYQDVPALIREIITDEAAALIAKYPTIESMEQCFSAAIEFALKNKRAVMHIYNSVNRDVYEYYLNSICDHIINAYFDTLLSGRTIDEDDRRVIVTAYRCESFGMITEWIGSGMKDDLVKDFYRICELRRGSLEEMIKRSIESPPRDK